jgi:hypothetical protein
MTSYDHGQGSIDTSIPRRAAMLMIRLVPSETVLPIRRGPGRIHPRIFNTEDAKNHEEKQWCASREAPEMSGGGQ